MRDFTDRVAVVTGAGSGIGRALCVELASHGAHIAAVDLEPERLASLQLEIEALKRNCSTHAVDVASREQMESLAKAVAQQHGAVHILVNNAGVSVNQRFEEQSVEDIQWITGINYWGVMYGCKFFLPLLHQVDEAHIVNLSSSAGFTGMKWQSSYSATKFAIAGLSECLYVELANTHINITCVHPGAVATNILDDARMAEGRRQKMLRTFKYATPPALAARAIFKAIKRKKFKLVLCVDSRVLHFLKRLTPVGTLKLMRWANND